MSVYLKNPNIRRPVLISSLIIPITPSSPVLSLAYRQSHFMVFAENSLDLRLDRQVFDTYLFWAKKELSSWITLTISSASQVVVSR